ncbi:MAG: DUF1501 domain-containing protein [Verrucomicrobiota bacterium]|nr:DUF1501 domain-containing protein [Verrucomicrobiota bacterium]
MQGALALPQPLAPKQPHHPPKAKRVIFLFQAGAPSHLDLFDYKPELEKWNGRRPPPELLQASRAAFVNPNSTLLGPQYKFRKAGQCGAEISELLPKLAEIVDDVAIIKSMTTDAFNHAPAQIFMNTGSQQLGRPGMGSWVTYGLGSESRDLPGYVVLSTGAHGTSGGASNWGCGFLPSACAGVPFRGQGDPALFLPRSPELACRSAAREVMDISAEPREILEMYGAQPGKSGYAHACLRARRLVERGVRFVQIFHEGWDHHGGLASGLENQCGKTDQPGAALVKDLKQRGLLEETLVVWGGEFGRSPMASGGNDGRDHHPNAFTMWLAGGGVKPGLTLGRSDEFGFEVTEDPVHVHDLQATILHLLGLDHTRLTCRFQGRDFRLTGGHGELVRKLLA